MLSVIGASPQAVLRSVAQRARKRRLSANLTQAGLADRAGVTLASLKRFERTGEVSFERLVRIAIALGASEGFDQLLQPKETRTLDELIAAPGPRKRGRHK